MCSFRQNHINVTDPDEPICVFGKVDEDDMFSTHVTDPDEPISKENDNIWEFIHVWMYLINDRQTWRSSATAKSMVLVGVPRSSGDIKHVLDCLSKAQKWHSYPRVLWTILHL
jgi:hypothetical protein